MEKKKNYKEISTNGPATIRVYNRMESIVKGFPTSVQLQISSDESTYAYLRDEQVDELIEALQKAKQVMPK